VQPDGLEAAAAIRVPVSQSLLQTRCNPPPTTHHPGQGCRAHVSDTDADNADLQLIVATGPFEAGQYAAVALDAVGGGRAVLPEPDTLAILARGLIS